MLRCMGRVLRKDEFNKWLRRVMNVNVEGSRPRGKLKKIWINEVEVDIVFKRVIVREFVGDIEKMEKVIMGLARLTLAFAGKGASKCLFIVCCFEAIL